MPLVDLGRKRRTGHWSAGWGHTERLNARGKSRPCAQPTAYSLVTPSARDFRPIYNWLGENSVVVTSELPGVTTSDVAINLQEDVLSLERARRPKQEQDVDLQRRERAYGTFTRAVQLPFCVDSDKLEARFNNGLREIELQRLEADRPKKSRSATAKIIERSAVMAQAVRPFSHQRAYNEYADGDYERVFTLSGDRIEATLKDGVLNLVLPKAESAKARKIELKAR
jgi:HSP20 family protein